MKKKDLCALNERYLKLRCKEIKQSNVRFLTPDNEFSGIIYRLFRVGKIFS